MTDFDSLLSLPPYGMGKDKKHAFLTEQLTALTRHHREQCPEYARILRAWGSLPDRAESYAELPFLPVRLFKEFNLKSVAEEDLYRTMTSSGTTGQQVSRIFLDRETGAAQSKALAKIVCDFLGSSRLPMIILDTSDLLKNRAVFSARGAGVLGFSIFAREKFFALDGNMRLDVEGLRAFIQKQEGRPIFLFGFTFIIWRHFLDELQRLRLQPDLSRAVLIHGGGWKKLADQAVSSDRFKKALRDACGITRVHDYYGMVEQTGAIYMECQKGYLHAPVWSDILIRRHDDFSPSPMGQKGLVQVMSTLPRSYPGHILLTEDEGAVLGEDDCPCGRKGKYFKIYGRIQRAEVRGCSDTYEQKPAI